jgi:hypothetical protein
MGRFSLEQAGCMAAIIHLCISLCCLQKFETEMKDVMEEAGQCEDPEEKKQEDKCEESQDCKNQVPRFSVSSGSHLSHVLLVLTDLSM